MDKKVLILIDNNNNGFFPNMIDNGIVRTIYRSNTKVSRVYRKIALKLNLPLKSTFFTDWYKEENISTIILFETGNARYILSFAKKRYPNARLILWYWNSVDNTINPADVSDVELWSFDPDDCKLHNMQYNTQFFPSHNLEGINIDFEEMRDAFFVGTDKGRIEELIKVRDILGRHHLTFDFHIVGNQEQQVPGMNINYQKSLSYKEVLKQDIRSRAIIDIVSSGQHGLTLRPLEALFLKKKLITNFSRIKEYDFYSTDNIFIVGEDDESRLETFLNEPFVAKIDERYYDMKNWLQRFMMPIY